MNASLLLAGGYLLGQGVAFGGQAYLKAFSDAETLGAAVIFLSMFSFAFQFNDFGNVSYVVGQFSRSRAHEVSSFLATRAYCAGIATLIVTGAASVTSNSPVSAALVAVFVGVAVVAATSRVGYFEYKRRYAVMSAMQSAAWMLVGLTLPIMHWIAPINWVWIIVSWLLIVTLSTAAHRTALPVTWKSADVAHLAYILPPLVGQINGRYILVAVQAVYGLANVGNFGLAKYLQVASSLSLGFLLRPIHAAINVQIRDAYRSEASVVKKYVWPLGLSLVPPLLAAIVATNGIIKIDGDVSWFMLTASLPFWVVAGISSNLSAQTLSPKVFSSIEYFCVGVNAVVFTLLLKKGIVVAVVMGEVSQYACSIVLGVFARRFYRLRS